MTYFSWIMWLKSALKREIMIRTVCYIPSDRNAALSVMTVKRGIDWLMCWKKVELCQGAWKRTVSISLTVICTSGIRIITTVKEAIVRLGLRKSISTLILSIKPAQNLNFSPTVKTLMDHVRTTNVHLSKTLTLNVPNAQTNTQSHLIASKDYKKFDPCSLI